MIPFPAALLAATPDAGGGGGGIIVRGADEVLINASSHNFTLPAGSAAGDRMVLFAGHGWGASNPAGWTVLKNQSGSNWNGGSWTKLLSATDISNGFVTIGFAGSYNGVVAGIVFEGGTGGVRMDNATRNSTGSVSRVVSQVGTAQSGDYIVSFGSARVNGACTCDTGAQLDQDSGANASGVLNGGLLASNVTDPAVTFTYPGTQSGDFQAFVVIQP